MLLKRRRSLEESSTTASMIQIMPVLLERFRSLEDPPTADSSYRLR